MSVKDGRGPRFPFHQNFDNWPPGEDSIVGCVAIVLVVLLVIAVLFYGLILNGPY